MSEKYQSGWYQDDEGHPFHVHGKNMSKGTMDALKVLAKAVHDEFPNLTIGKVYKTPVGTPARLLKLHTEREDGKVVCIADVEYVHEALRGAVGWWRARELREWDGVDYPSEDTP